MLRASQCLKVSIFLTDKHPELVTPRQQAGIYFFFQRDYHVGGAGAVTTTSALRSGRPGKRTGGCDRPRRPAGRGAGSDVRLAGPPAPLLSDGGRVLCAGTGGLVQAAAPVPGSRPRRRGLRARQVEDRKSPR